MIKSVLFFLILFTVMLDGAKSMPDLSIGRSQSMKTEPPAPYMPMAGEGKKKKGFFSFLKKDKKFTVVRVYLFNISSKFHRNIFLYRFVE